ncbi:ribonuclease HII [Mycoplasmopsis adleri]|uniref:ribonuclease HII n=1 Tax=Mycoplasmopsis adleri TaxID=51362 RepID=UPI003872B1E1
MLNYEKENYKDYKLIAGCDEAGRGCCAGPLVVAAVIMNPDYVNDAINDSKQLSEPKREQLFEIIKENALSYQIKVISNKEVDELNPKAASRYGMFLAVKDLKIKPDLVITDFEKVENLDIKQINLVKGDALSFNVACASILAKVYRDHLMIDLDKKYPNYNFAKNKGYCTKDHTAAIEKYGICDEHRITYKNVKKALEVFESKNN